MVGHLCERERGAEFIHDANTIYGTVERKDAVRPVTLYRLDRFIEFDTGKRFGISHVALWLTLKKLMFS